MISLQVPDEILKDFDKVQQDLGYISRSEALRDAIYKFIRDYKVKKGFGGVQKAVVSVTYSPEQTLLEEMSLIEHRFENEVKSYMDYPLDGTSLRIYLIIGDVSRINDFIAAFNGIRDVKTDMMYI